MPHLALYQELAALTGEMARAAGAQDWERLTALSPDYAALAARLRAAGAPTAGEAGDIAPLIEAILADQAAIETQTRPWLDDVRQSLKFERTEQAIRSAYRPLP